MNFQTASLKELKTFTTENQIEVIGDKRKKESYLVAIEAWQVEQSTEVNNVDNSHYPNNTNKSVNYYVSEKEFTVVIPQDLQQPTEIIDVDTQPSNPSLSNFLILLPAMFAVLSIIFLIKTIILFIDFIVRFIIFIYPYFEKYLYRFSLLINRVKNFESSRKEKLITV